MTLLSKPGTLFKIVYLSREEEEILMYLETTKVKGSSRDFFEHFFLNSKGKKISQFSKHQDPNMYLNLTRIDLGETQK